MRDETNRTGKHPLLKNSVVIAISKAVANDLGYGMLISKQLFMERFLQLAHDACEQVGMEPPKARDWVIQLSYAAEKYSGCLFRDEANVYVLPGATTITEQALKDRDEPYHAFLCVLHRPLWDW